MVIVKNLESAWCFSITLRGLSWARGFWASQIQFFELHGPVAWGCARSSHGEAMWHPGWNPSGLMNFHEGESEM